MEWLTRIPLLGPAITRLTRSHAWRAWRHYGEVRGDRLAGAATYMGFLAIFPMIAVGVAITAALLSSGQVRDIEQTLTENFPVLSDQLDLNGLVRNAAPVGIISGALLLYSTLGCVDTLRGSIRSIWGAPEGLGNVVRQKATDLGLLAGLAGVLAVSVGASALATALLGQAADWLDLSQHGAGRVLLRIAGLAIAVLADFLLVVYLLRWLPGLHPRRGPLLQAALIGAVGVEALKLLLSGYLSEVATKSMYGAFGTPVAVLLWMNFMMRLLLYCAAWTATAPDREGQEAPAGSGEPPPGRTAQSG